MPYTFHKKAEYILIFRSNFWCQGLEAARDDGFVDRREMIVPHAPELPHPCLSTPGFLSAANPGFHPGRTLMFVRLLQVRIQDLCRGGLKRDFADIVQRSRGGGKNLGLKIRGRGGPAPQTPPPPLDLHLGCQTSGATSLVTSKLLMIVSII